MTLRDQMRLDPYPDYIAHHGILGMKWGIRHTPAQLGHHTPKPRKLESGKTGDYKNDGETVKQTYGKGKTRLVQSRNGETSQNAGKSKLVQIMEYHDQKKAAKARAEAREQKKREAEKAAKTAEKQRRKALGKEGRLKEDYQKKGMSEQEAADAASSKVKRDRYIKIGVAAAATAVTAYGAYKIKTEGLDNISKKGGDLVGKILGTGDRVVNEAKTAKQDFALEQKASRQRAKLVKVAEERGKTASEVLNRLTVGTNLSDDTKHSISNSIGAWMTRNDDASLRFGSRGNTVSDLEEYLSRVYPSIVKRA